MDDLIERHGVVNEPGRPVMSLGVAWRDGVTICLTAADRSADVGGQTRQALHAIDRFLQAAGSSRSQLLTTQVWVRRRDDLATVCAVWNAWVDADHPPACSFVCSAMARPEILVEIKVTAARAGRAATLSRR